MMLLDLPSEPTSFFTPVLLNNFLSLTKGEFLPDPGPFSLALLPTLATSTIREDSYHNNYYHLSELLNP